MFTASEAPAPKADCRIHSVWWTKESFFLLGCSTANFIYRYTLAVLFANHLFSCLLPHICLFEDTHLVGVGCVCVFGVKKNTTCNDHKCFDMDFPFSRSQPSFHDLVIFLHSASPVLQAWCVRSVVTSGASRHPQPEIISPSPSAPCPPIYGSHLWFYSSKNLFSSKWKLLTKTRLIALADIQRIFWANSSQILLFASIQKYVARKSGIVYSLLSFVCFVRFSFPPEDRTTISPAPSRCDCHMAPRRRAPQTLKTASIAPTKVDGFQVCFSWLLTNDHNSVLFCFFWLFQRSKS